MPPQFFWSGAIPHLTPCASPSRLLDDSPEAAERWSQPFPLSTCRHRLLSLVSLVLSLPQSCKLGAPPSALPPVRVASDLFCPPPRPAIPCDEPMTPTPLNIERFSSTLNTEGILRDRLASCSLWGGLLSYCVCFASVSSSQITLRL